MHEQSNIISMKQDNLWSVCIIQALWKELMKRSTYCMYWQWTVSDNFHPKLAHKVTLSIIEVTRSHNVKKYYHCHVKEAFICFSWLQFVFHRFFLIFLTRKLTCFASLACMIHIIQNGFMFWNMDVYDLLKHIFTFNNL